MFQNISFLTNFSKCLFSLIKYLYNKDKGHYGTTKAMDTQTPYMQFNNSFTRNSGVSRHIQLTYLVKRSEKG